MREVIVCCNNCKQVIKDARIIMLSAVDVDVNESSLGNGMLIEDLHICSKCFSDVIERLKTYNRTSVRKKELDQDYNSDAKENQVVKAESNVEKPKLVTNADGRSYELDNDEIVARFKELGSVQSVARTYDVSDHCIRKRIEKWQEEHGEQILEKYKKDTKSQVIKLMKKGIAYKDIAAEVGLSYKRVWTICNNYKAEQKKKERRNADKKVNALSGLDDDPFKYVDDFYN